MKKTTETIPLELDLQVQYEFEDSKGFFAEPGNPSTYVFPTTYTELKSVKLNGVEILPSLTEAQKKQIVHSLEYTTEIEYI